MSDKAWTRKVMNFTWTKVKAEETLLEACRNSNVQIDSQIWVKGRKTNRMT